MPGFDFDRLMAIARGEYIAEPSMTDGNLALDVSNESEEGITVSRIEAEPELHDDESGSLRISEGTSPMIPLHEAPAHSSLAAVKSPRLDRREWASIVAAFKETCRRGNIGYRLRQDERGRFHIELTASPDTRRGIAFAALVVKLDQEPHIETALIEELSRT